MDTEISSRDLARLLDVSQKTIALWAKTGVVVRTAHGKFDRDQSIMGFARYMRGLLAAKGGETAATAVATERAALLRAQRERIERVNAQESGRLLPAAQYEAELTAAMRYLRDNLLRIPVRLVGVDREVMTQVDRGIREALVELAAGRSLTGKDLRDYGADDDHGNEGLSP